MSRPQDQVQLKTTLADVVRERGEELGLSQSDVARRLKKPPATISKWWNGEVTIQMANLIRLAAVLDTHPAALIGEAERRRAAAQASAEATQGVGNDNGGAQDLGTTRAREADTAIYSLVPEEVLGNPTHQALWRRLTFIWKRRNENPGLFSVIEQTMEQWELQFGGAVAVAEIVNGKTRATKKKHVRSDNLSGTVTAG